MSRKNKDHPTKGQINISKPSDSSSSSKGKLSGNSVKMDEDINDISAAYGHE